MQSLVNTARNAAIAKIPELIEKNEPQIEQQLILLLQKMPPEERKLFFDNWKKVDAVVRRTLNEPAPAPIKAGRKKRTKRNTRSKH